MIFVYGKPGCMACKMTENMMNDLKIDFTYVDVYKDEKGLERLKSKGVSTLPFVESDSNEWFGFKPEEIEKLKKI